MLGRKQPENPSPQRGPENPALQTLLRRLTQRHHQIGGPTRTSTATNRTMPAAVIHNFHVNQISLQFHRPTRQLTLVTLRSADTLRLTFPGSHFVADPRFTSSVAFS